MRILLIIVPLAISITVLFAASQLLGAATPPPVLAAPKINSQGIHGIVTYGGVPTGSIPLELWFKGQNSNFITETTLTLPDGSFSFMPLHSLGAGESYYVEFFNDMLLDDRFLNSWVTGHITQFSTGQDIDLGNFIIDNVPQLSPPYGSKVSLPVDFIWTPRATTDDKYQIRFTDKSYNPLYLSPILDYTNTFRLDDLPTGLEFDTSIYWEMLVYRDGGSGVNYDWFEITFSSTQQTFLPLIYR